MYRGVLKRKQLLAGLSFVLAVSALPALAHEAEPAEPRASLSAEASSEVGQDRVEITLAAELSGDSQTEVAEALNKRLDSVMKRAKGHEGIEARSGSYRIWPTTDRDGKIAEWRGQAEILLESSDFPAVSKLAADLGDRMPIAGLSFSVSPERRAAEEQKLLGQAVEAFKARAQALTQALGFAGYRFHTVELGGQGAMPPVPMPRMMMSAMAADKAAAPVEGGRERVSVSVQGTIVLLPK